MALITELIDAEDGHEIVTAAVGNILAVEIANQQALALADGKNPEAWRADVYVNRMRPFDTRIEGDDLTPIVNVWFKSSDYDKSSSTVRPMSANGDWVVDIYGFGVAARDATSGGQVAGDKLAKSEADRWLGIVRRILMSGQYTYLGSPRANTKPDPSLLKQWCYGRSVDSVNSFQPELESRSVVSCIGSRLALGVHYLVDSPQILGEVFEALSTQVKREEDGLLLVELETDISGS